jgi:HJR/Mrr/RecB family endonuclease
LRDRDEQSSVTPDDLQKMDDNQFEALSREVHDPHYIDFESINDFDEDTEDEKIQSSIENIADVDRIHSLLISLKTATQNCDISAIKSLEPEIVAECNEIGVNIGEIFKCIDDCLSRLSISAPSLLYVPNSPTIFLPQLVKVVDTSLIPRIKADPSLIYRVHPRQFEEVIADIFSKFGFLVELTKQTRDGGRDIIALLNKMDINCKYIIECKRYAPTRKVSIGIVQRLLGVKVAEAANKAILVTTSSYTLDARRFESNHLWDLSLKDNNDILGWIKAC